MKFATQSLLKHIFRIAVYTTIVLCGMFFEAHTSAVFASPISTTIDTQADWLKGHYEFNSIDASTSAGFIQLQKDNGSWDASGPANLNHYIQGNTKMIKVNQFLYIFRNNSNGQFLRYDMETTEWKEMAFPLVEPNGVLDATTNGTDTIWAFATNTGRKHFMQYYIPTNTWTFLADAPNTLNGPASLKYVPVTINGVTTNYIFAIQGGSYYFWKYTVSGGSDVNAINTWTNIQNTTGYCQSYCDLTYDGSRYLYMATDWQSPDYFMRYDTQSGGAWVLRGRPPLDGSFSNALELVRVGDDFYTLRGAGTRTFYKYTYSSNTWAQVADSPMPTSTGSLVYDENNARIIAYLDIGALLYYYPLTNTWSQPLQGPPANAYQKGQNLANNGTNEIYMCRGQGSNACYRYYISGGSANTWAALPTAPAGLYYNPVTYMGGYLYTGYSGFYRINPNSGGWETLTALPGAFGEGSQLVASDSSLFALRGGGNAQLYKYNGSTWTAAGVKANFPDAVYRGAGMVKAGAFLYALGGYNRGRFYRYEESLGVAGTWVELASIPVGVYSGGSMTYDGGDFIYVQSGGENDITGRQMYRYSISTNYWQRMADTPQMMRLGTGMTYLNSSIYSYQGYGFGMYRYIPPTGARTYTQYNNTNNVISGYWYSPVYDLFGIKTWSSFSKSDSTLGTTQVNYYSRTSDSQNTWTDWAPITDGNVQTQALRYTQFKLELKGAGNGSESPSVDSFTFAYDPDDEGPDMTNFSIEAYSASGGANLTSGNSYSGAHPYFQWNGAVDALSSVSGYYVYFGTNASATPSTDGTYQIGTSYTVNTGMSYDQSYYLIIQAKDGSGNVSTAVPGFTYHYIGVSPTTTKTLTTQADWDSNEATKSGIYSGNSTWWNQSYLYRKQLTISPLANVPINSVVKLSTDTAVLVTAGKVRADRKDWRIVYWNGSTWKEVDRDYTDTTTTYFVLQKGINTGVPDTNYYVYYGNANETTDPMSNMGSYMGGAKWGGALSFDGGDYVKIPSMINNQSQLTIEGWFKYNNSNSYRYVYGDASGQVSAGIYSGQNYMVYSFRTAGSGAPVQYSSMYGTTQLEPAKWYHFAVTYNATTGDYKTYLNGRLDYSRASLVGNVAITAQQYIGYSAGYYHYGYLDEFRISNNVRYTADFIPSTTKFVTDANTLGLYHFDDDPGQTLADSSGNNNTGTLGATAAVVETTDPTWTSGNTGALLFDGINDYIRLPAGLTTAINNKAALTIEGWFKHVAASGNRWFYGDTVAAQQIAIGINGTDNTMMYNFKTATSGQFSGAVGSTTLTPNNWYHFAVVYDATAGTYNAYINGQLDYSRASLSGNVSVTNQQILGGSSLVGYYSGYLAEIRISSIVRYAAPFTPPVIPSTGIFVTDASTLALYHMNDNNYQTLTDTTGSYAGTLGSAAGVDTNDPTWVMSQIPVTVSDTEENVPVTPADNGISLESMNNGAWAGYQIGTLPWGGRMYYGSGIYVNSKLYILRGSNSPTFYQYDTTTLTWKQLADTPVGTGGTNGTYYAAMAYDGGDYIYALRGNTTPDFYRYSISQNTWDLASLTQPTANFANGAILVKGKDRDGVDVYYAIQGGGYSGFFVYYPGAANRWVSKTSPPSTVTAGSGMVYDPNDRSLYLTLGQSYGFYNYSIVDDAWDTTAVSPPFPPYPMGFTNNNLMPYGNYLYFFTSYDYQQNGDLRHIVWRYDKINKRWDNIDIATEFFARYGATIYDGSRYVYLIQGESSGNTGLTQVARYDLQTNRISPETPPLPMEKTYEGNGSNFYHAAYTDSSLAFDGNDTVYFAQGATNYIDKYQVSTKRWTRLPDIPCLYYGGLVHTGSSLFVFCGNLTKTGYRFDVGNNNWSQIADSPDTLRPGGSQPAVYDGVGAIYVLRGVNTQTLYKYTIATNVWSTESSAVGPTIPNSNGVGASITYDGSDTLYVFLGNQSNLFYKYKISAPSGWMGLAPAPEGIYYGSGSVYNNGKIYVTSGSNNTSMYVYDVATNTWGMGMFAPSQIYAGGALVKGPGNSMYATQGNYMYTFWKYILPSSSTSYVNKGIFTSAPTDLGRPYDFAGLTITLASPSATTTSFETRTSTDAATWNDWTPVFGMKKSASSTVYSFNINSLPKKYIQVRATLESEESVESPVISNMQIEYYDDSTSPTNPTTLQSFKTAAKTAGEELQTNTWHNYESPYFEWTGAADNLGGSGLAGYYVYFGRVEDADPSLLGALQTTASYSASLATSGTDDGEYYLKIRTVDNAGNISSDTWTPFHYRYDHTDPNIIGTVGINPRTYTKTNNFAMSWTPVTDALSNATSSGLLGYYYQASSSASIINDQFTTEASVSGILAYQEGENNFSVRVADSAGNTTAYKNATFYYNVTPPSEPSELGVDLSQAGANKFTFTWQKPITIKGTVKEYRYVINALPNDGNISTTSATLVTNQKGTRTGSNTFYVVAVDEAGNVDYDNFSFLDFDVNISAPSNPLAPETFDNSIRNTQSYRVGITWDKPLSMGSAFDRYEIWASSTNIECSTSMDSYGFAGSTAGTSDGGSYVVTSLANEKLLSQMYYFCVLACSSNNQCSSPSTTVSNFPTGRWLVAPELIASQSATVKTKSAIVNWSTNRPSNSFVKFGKTSGNYTTEVGSSNQVTYHEITLLGLDPGTTYYYKMLWADEDGNMGSTGEMSFSTNPAPFISNVKFSRVNINSAEVTFTIKSAIKASVQYGKTISYGSVESISTSKSETTYTVEIAKLIEGTAYHLRIAGEDDEANIYYSDDYTFETLPTPKILNLRLQQVAGMPTATLRLLWTSNTLITSVVSYYPTANPERAIDSISLALKKNHEVILKNLNDDTEYTLVIKGKDSIGNDSQTETKTIKTSNDMRPPEIQNMNVESTIVGVGDSAKAQIVVSWDTDEPATAQVEYAQGTGTSYGQTTQEDSNLTTNHTVTITGLTPAKIYHLRATSKDKASNIGQSFDTVIITPKSTKDALTLVIENLSKTFGFLNNLNLKQ